MLSFCQLGFGVRANAHSDGAIRPWRHPMATFLWGFRELKPLGSKPDLCSGNPGPAKVPTNYTSRCNPNEGSPFDEIAPIAFCEVSGGFSN